MTDLERSLTSLGFVKVSLRQDLETSLIKKFNPILNTRKKS